MYDPARGKPSVVPGVLYDDLPAAAEWISQTLGFLEMIRAVLPDGWSGRFEPERDGSSLLLGRRGGQFGDSSSITHVSVDDVDSRRRGRSLTGDHCSTNPVIDRGKSVNPSRGPGTPAVGDPHHVKDTDPSVWYETILGPVQG